MRPRDRSGEAKILQRIFTDYANSEPVRDIVAGSIVKEPLQEKYKALELERAGLATHFGSSRRMAAATS